jgi:hypothetical protein
VLSIEALKLAQYGEQPVKRLAIQEQRRLIRFPYLQRRVLASDRAGIEGAADRRIGLQVDIRSRVRMTVARIGPRPLITETAKSADDPAGWSVDP